MNKFWYSFVLRMAICLTLGGLFQIVSNGWYTLDWTSLFTFSLLNFIFSLIEAKAG